MTVTRFGPILVATVVVGCGSSSTTPPPQPSPTPSPTNPARTPPGDPPRGKLQDQSKDEADGLTVRYRGTGVSLAELPAVAQRFGIPLSGKADFEIDVIVPKIRGMPDYTQATGSIDLACTKCQIGDDVAKLRLPPKNGRAGFADDGFPFGKLLVDRFEAKARITGGKLELTSWKVESPDLAMEANLTVTFSRALEASALEGCMRWKPSPELEQRDPKTHAMLLLTGARRGADGYFQIQLGGTVGESRKLARDCSAAI